MTGVDVALGQLEALVALADEGSFTRAGHLLGLTQSAVSRAIATLERRLGAPVAHRGTSRVALTDLGEQVVVHARRIQGDLDAVAELARRPVGELRVGAVASALVRAVPAAVDRLRAQRPACVVWTVQGDDDELADWYAAGTIDLAVSTWDTQRFTDPGNSQASVTSPSRHRELQDAFLAVLPARHPLASADRVGLRALVEAGVADPGGTCGPQLAAGFTAHGVPWAPAHVVRDAATVLSMSAADITLGVLPALAAPSPPPPRVVLRPLDPPLSRSVYIHHRDTPEAIRLGELLAQPRDARSNIA